MFIKIQTSDKSNGNKGSVSALANYLEKEDLNMEKRAIENDKLPNPRTGFFSQNREGLLKSEVISSIDTNKKGLGKNDAKFYSITFSPSEKEQKALLKNITGRKINSVKELSRNELKAYEKTLQEFTRLAMNEYASNFKRDGLTTGKQLLYFGKIEHLRHYKGTDKEVKKGEKNSGSPKAGLQTHIHLIVGRKDIEMKFKLSPLANERGHKNNSKLNGKKVQRGFDRNLFNIKAEKLFDLQFNYARNTEEKVEYRIEASKKDEKLEISTKRQLIDQYNERNSFQEKDKELSHGNKNSLNINTEFEI